ncbi:hypothetical protein DM02DRAFT_674522 [Periconia macrospinosa]|uniref:Rhodopsin domain-containing protein n=1 Tax=Periconia macrospinosa TaxID=97972 RepID=A0A2V1DFN9_9PLEO|nr:hypothetical protein DM02DRAFT_674522 [Periconia macrospinosa]
MAIKGKAVGGIAAMWVLTSLTLVSLLLRLYTRLAITKAFGNDDHVFNIAFIFLLVMTSLYTKSATLGLGQTVAEIGDLDLVSRAILWEAIGQTFTVLGTAIAKWSLGLFLLRLVIERWHKILIWTAMGCLMAASISVVFTFWMQCTPYEYLWDRRIPGGYCHISAIPASTVLNITTVVVDLLFAVLPWLFIWALQIKKQEKIVILTSMSLGIFAAGCGVKRALSVGGLSSPEYLRDSLDLLIWSAAEHAVTLICICIPVCRPLYKRIARSYFSQKSTLGSHKMTPNTPQKGDIELRAGAGGSSSKKIKTTSDSLLRTTIQDNKSDEEILLRTDRGDIQPPSQVKMSRGIRVTHEFQTTSEEEGAFRTKNVR